MNKYSKLQLVRQTLCGRSRRRPCLTGSTPPASGTLLLVLVDSAIAERRRRERGRGRRESGAIIFAFTLCFTGSCLEIQICVVEGTPSERKF